MYKLLLALFILFGFSAPMISADNPPQRVWDHPQAEENFNNHDGFFRFIIAPVRVEFHPDRTIVDMEVRYRPDSRFDIPSGIVLSADGKEYPLIEADGIELEKRMYCPPSGVKHFRLSFEPLPTGIEKFDFDDRDGIKIKGITDPAVTSRRLLSTNWRNDRTGDWEIGFFDEGVIYDARFWDYVGDSRPMDKGSFEITDGELTLKVKIGKLKNGRRKICVGNNPEVECSMISSRTLPDYPVADNRAEFTDTRYAAVDTVELRGWLKGSPKKIESYSALISDLITGKMGDATVCDVDSLGRFTMKIPLLNTTECSFDWKNTFIRTVLEPGQHYYLFYDLGRGQKLFMGSDSRLQNELLSFPLTWVKSYDDMLKDGDEALFLASVSRDMNADLQSLDSLCSAHPFLSKRFRVFSEGNLYNQYALQVSQSRFRSPGLKLGDASVEFLQDLFRNHRYKPYPTHRDYSYYVKDLVDDFVMKNPGAIEFGAMDSMTLREAESLVQLKYLKCGLQYLDSLGADEDARSLWVARMVSDNLNSNHRALSLQQEEFMKTAISTPATLQILQEQNEMYNALERRVKGESTQWAMTNIPMSESAKDGKALLDSILAPHKGKIVLLDIWGTWCKPCCQALAESQKEYAELAPYDIVYVYLANNSPEDSWKNIIEEYNVKGDNCFHYNLPSEQQERIENYLGVRSFPTYCLFDRDGNLLPFRVDARNLADLRRVLDKL